MIALVTVSEEADYLKILLAEIFLWKKWIPAVLIHCDGATTIAKVENHYYNDKRRQIRSKRNTVRECLFRIC